MSLGLAINQITSKWNVFPQGFNFPVNKITKNLQSNYEGEIYLLQYGSYTPFLDRYSEYNKITIKDVLPFPKKREISLRVNWLAKKKINLKACNKLLQKSINQNHITNGGPLVQKLEQDLYEMLKINRSKAIIVVNNGSSALHALISGIMLHEEKELNWATQSFTFPTSVQGSLMGCHIVDIDNDGGLDLTLIDPTSINGIIVTNVFGYLLNIEKYVSWAQRYGKILIFDNAATSYSVYKGTNSCNYGHGSIISFHHTKPIGFGEGGAIIVDKKYETSIRRIINFGFKPGSHKWHKWGSNFKMSDIAAAYILQYMSNVDKIRAKHQKLYKIFKREIDQISGVSLLSDHSDDAPFVSCFVLVFKNKKHAQEEYFLENGIYCRKYYHPLQNLPKVSDLYARDLCIPCNIDMTEKDIYDIINLLLALLNKNKKKEVIIVPMMESIEFNTYSITEAKNLDIIYPDIYFTPEYGKVVEVSDRGTWELVTYANNRILHVYLKRPIQSEGTMYYDLISPYGYSGLYFATDVDSKEMQEYFNKFKIFALQNNYVCEFIRFNPYLVTKQQIDYMAIPWKTVKDTYGIVMNTTYDEYFKQTKSNHRYAVRKAVRDGYIFQIKQLENVDVQKGSDFRILYNETMKKCNAKPYYYFSDKYYKLLVKLGCLISYAKMNNEIIGASIFFKHNNDKLHYHLSCRKDDFKNVSNFVLDGTIRWAFENKITFFHLGGGLSAGDNLARFKQALSNASFNYYYSPVCYNDVIYDKLVKDRCLELGKKKGELDKNYYPLYKSN